MYLYTSYADLYAGALFITKSTGFCLSFHSCRGSDCGYLDRFYTNYSYDYRGHISSYSRYDVIEYHNVKLHFTSLAFTHKDVGGYEGLVDKYFLATATIRGSTTPNGIKL